MTSTNGFVPSGDASVAIPIHVRVVGGRLELAQNAIEVHLHRVSGSHFAGRVDDVRFLDTRGTYAGWHLTADVVDAHAETVRFTPDDVAVLNGFPDGLLNPGPQEWTGASVTLASAVAGCGAGVYSVGATIDADLDRGPTRNDTIALELRLA